jgi:hypothetical protein
MEIIRLTTTIEQDGEIHLANLPLRKGQRVEMIVLSEPSPDQRPMLTADQLAHSDLIGLWEDRTDIGDSAEFARELREKGQHRTV